MGVPLNHLFSRDFPLGTPFMEPPIWFQGCIHSKMAMFPHVPETRFGDAQILMARTIFCAWQKQRVVCYTIHHSPINCWE